MDSSSFFEFSCTNLLFFLNLCFLRTCYYIFFANVGAFSGSFILFFSVP